MDYRKEKTEIALANAMITLLETRSFKKITVNDICAEAMVSRSAFYSHFEDKYALFQFVMEMLKRRIFEETTELNTYHLFRHSLHRISANSRAIKNLMGSGLDMELINMMRNAFQQDMERMIRARNISTDDLPAPVELMATYYSAGITQSVLYWLDHEQKFTIEEMATALSRLLPPNIHQEC